MVKLSSYVIHIVLLIFIVSRLTPPFGEYGAIKRYYLKKNNNNNNNLNKSKHELLCFVVSVPCSAKLSRSFPKQYCNSRNVAESELDSLEAKSLEVQGAIFVL